MTFSVSPSVIVKEIDATSTIPAVVNSPAGIAGVFKWGPVLDPVLITSESELVNRFGKPSDFNAETFFTAADFLAYSNALYVTRVTNSSVIASASGIAFSAKYPGSLGNDLIVSYVTQSTFYEKMYNIGSVYGTIAYASKTLEVEFVSEIDTSLIPGDIVRIGNNSNGYQENVLVSITANGQDVGTSRYKYSLVFEKPFTLISTDFQDVSIQRYWKYYNKFSGKPKTSDSIHVVVVDGVGNISGDKNTILEIYENVSTIAGAKTSDGTSNYYKDVINNGSNWIKTNDSVVIGTSDIKYSTLSGGVDGDDEDTIDFGVVALGYDKYKNADEIDVSFILQGKASGASNKTDLANYILNNIIDERKDSMLFISPAYEDVVTPTNVEDKLENIIEFRNGITSSSYWVMDSGYKYRYDKYNDVYRWTPLNGDIAGLTAKVDPWVSPAGYNRGIVKNAAKLAYNPNKTHRDALYGSDINPVISVKGKGILLFGDKTGLGQSSAFDRINVRRLFITVEKAIATIAASFLFEFNDTYTQLQFKNTIVPYLTTIQGKRGIVNFKVVSDSTINTADVINSNNFRAQIFIVPAYSISTISLDFIAVKNGVEFSEVVY